ncbi:hypothetical protein D3C75_815930 [compost metagenome]
MLLTFCERVQHILQLFLQQLISSCVCRRKRLLILNEITQMRIIFFTDRCFQ